jgi:hypothetical protein
MKVFVFILAVFLLASGCGNGGGKPIGIDYGSIHTGSDGIKLEYVSNAPPSEVLAPNSGSANYPFKVAMILKNKGAFDVENGMVALTVEDDYMNVDSTSKIFSLKGKSIFNPAGDEELMAFTATTKKFKEGQSEKHGSIIVATACYKYQTELKVNECIDTDILGYSKRQKTCTTKDEDFSNQGAPVAVTKVESKIYSEGDGQKVDFVKPQYIIHIKNVGGGQIFNPQADLGTFCSADFNTKDPDSFRRVWNTVSVSAKLSDKDLICQPNPVKLRSSEDVVRCSVKDEDKVPAQITSYYSPLIITLNYGYTTTITKDITIIKEVGY